MSQTVLNIQISLDPGSNQQAQGQAEGGDAAAQDLRHQADGAQILIVDRDHWGEQRSALRSSATRQGIRLEMKGLKLGLEFCKNEVCGMQGRQNVEKRIGEVGAWLPTSWDAARFHGPPQPDHQTLSDVHPGEDFGFAGAFAMYATSLTR
ncbi:uncharacterized protein BO95DRAFT_507455 [Aspergillus brunneoviolaceus CBS 621.78]|uniref:Uncharacterized protein n=1 Tax=Aspergillus brunneoviolaceus CBS 621.78 TaxID=1450534 RepID=A0ACD1FVP6_9EURO|nr:hypothetical protein BO95DRAFT_507455 [Aspergillus brunneoviolaceus CBS 621.78]RAH41083.1 hypothetical protein BO95DRAFT_507455 [Aspergillus brunneoviolaceus CBS 621.78]